MHGLSRDEASGVWGAGPGAGKHSDERGVQPRGSCATRKKHGDGPSPCYFQVAAPAYVLQLYSYIVAPGYSVQWFWAREPLAAHQALAG
eukprot:5544494-Prymnesium_polylepis.1